MSDLLDGFRWVADSDNWWGGNGLVPRIGEHLWYSLLATVIAVAVALPVGLFIGHTGRGRFVAAGAGNVLRAIPTFGVVALLFAWRPLSLWPPLLALAALAVPPVLLNTAAGVEAVEPQARDAAIGMGLTGRQVLLGVEVPCALPLILAGVRSAANQVIATATVAGFKGLGGLGRFIFSGYGTQRYNVVWGASIVVIALVLLVEAIFVVVQRAVVSPGLVAARGGQRRGRRPR